jgi:hypothetical protein
MNNEKKNEWNWKTQIFNDIYHRPPGGGRFYVMVLEKLHDLPRTYISL